MTNIDQQSVALPKAVQIGHGKTPTTFAGDGAFLAFLGQVIATTTLQVPAMPRLGMPPQPSAPLPDSIAQQPDSNPESTDIAASFLVANAVITPIQVGSDQGGLTASPAPSPHETAGNGPTLDRRQAIEHNTSAMPMAKPIDWQQVQGHTPIATPQTDAPTTTGISAHQFHIQNASPTQTPPPNPAESVAAQPVRTSILDGFAGSETNFSRTVNGVWPLGAPTERQLTGTSDQPAAKTPMQNPPLAPQTATQPPNRADIVTDQQVPTQLGPPNRDQIEANPLLHAPVTLPLAETTVTSQGARSIVSPSPSPVAQTPPVTWQAAWQMNRETQIEVKLPQDIGTPTTMPLPLVHDDFATPPASGTLAGSPSLIQNIAPNPAPDKAANAPFAGTVAEGPNIQPNPTTPPQNAEFALPLIKMVSPLQNTAAVPPVSLLSPQNTPLTVQPIQPENHIGIRTTKAETQLAAEPSPQLNAAPTTVSIAGPTMRTRVFVAPDAKPYAAETGQIIPALQSRQAGPANGFQPINQNPERPINNPVPRGKAETDARPNSLTEATMATAAVQPFLKNQAPAKPVTELKPTSKFIASTAGLVVDPQARSLPKPIQEMPDSAVPAVARTEIAKTTLMPDRATYYDAVFLTSGQSANSTQAAPQTVAPPAIPTSIPMSELPHQIRQHLSTGKQTSLELSLAPEELGKLRLLMTPDGDKIRIVVQAERPETLDLLRRNSESFTADLRNSGFAGASFTFGGWGDQQPDSKSQKQVINTQAFDTAAKNEAAPNPYSAAPKATGLDLRV